MADFEPKQFGKYFLIEKLAVGGMAEIYKAKTFGVDGFEKELAIKRILPHCSADKDFITMLIDEAKLSVMLSHANIVQVYDLGKVGDDYFISMEFIHGINLRDILYRCREGKIPIPPDISVYITSEICKGLDYAHRKTDQHGHPLNIVHRDVSPQNVLISYEGEVKIVDFGIAKAAMNISHTMAGILKGKIAYMSPEQAMGKAIDGRTDIFSAGILLYEMLTGTRLFTGESQFEVLKKIRTTRISAEGLPDSIPAPLGPVVAKALSYNIENRYRYAGDLQIELTKYLYSTYVDFSPRKLASFIKEIFSTEMREEQITRAREAGFEVQTSSMSVGEGAKQMEIVHRETVVDLKQAPLTEEAPQALGETRLVAKPSAKKILEREARTEKTKKIKNRALKLTAAAILVVAFAGLTLWFGPRFVKKEKAVETVAQAATGTARVTSEPTGAKIFIDGSDTGQVTPALISNLEITKTYAIRVEKEGFDPSEKALRITSPEEISIPFPLVLASGVLNVISDPAGAAISIDGKLTGFSTPATLEKIPLGKDIRITLSKPEYEDFEQVINLSSAKPQKLAAKLKGIVAQTGRLVISSVPSGAAIAINGVDSGKTTPATLTNLEPKKYTVSISMTGYETWSEPFDVQTGQSVAVNAKLVQSVLPTPPVSPPSQVPTTEEKISKGSLKVTSTPDGARIFLDGKSTGLKTPATIYDLKIGASYSVRLDLDGYKSATKRKSIKKEGESLFATLVKTEQKLKEEKPPTEIPPPATQEQKPEKPPAAKEEPAEAVGGKTGTIKVASNPSGADVFINAEHRGKTPLSVTAPAGSATVLISKEGMAKVTRRVTVKPGQTVSISEDLGDIYGEVSLASDPPKAQVTFDGQSIPAPTPVTVRRVKKDQSHTVTISLPGYKSWTRTFQMDSGSKSFNVTLQPQ